MPSQYLYKSTFLSLFISNALYSGAQAQESIFTIPSPQNESFADVGGVVLIRDTYVGSDDSETRIAPYVNAEYKGRVFFKPGRGVGVYAIKNDKFRLSASGNLAIGRDTEDTPFRDQGFEDELLEINSTVTFDVAARYYTPLGALEVVSAIPVGGDLNGQRVDALFTTEIKPFKNLRITPGVRATYQSSGWVNSIYGIDTDQAATLGVDAFSLGGRVSTLGAHAVGHYQLPHNLELLGFVNYSRLLGSVNDSPLTGSNNSITAALGIARQF